LKIMNAAVLCLAISAFGAPQAQAQMTWTDKGFFNLSGGAQVGSHTVATTSTFDIYDEQARVDTSQKIKGAGFFDVNAGYKVWRNLAIGLGYSFTSSSADATISASVPDPVFFDRPRSTSGSAGGLKHTESVVHVIATWMVPVTDKIDVAVSAGPSVFAVKQDLVSALTIGEPGPTISGTTITKASKTGPGANFGVDVTYMINKRFGAGALARYTWGSVELPGATKKLTVGGFQVGAGARVRF